MYLIGRVRREGSERYEFCSKAFSNAIDGMACTAIQDRDKLLLVTYPGVELAEIRQKDL
jgi:hypothetical protein